MGKSDGFSRYVCDRCGKTAFMSQSDNQADNWRTVRRYMSDNSETTRLLCPECAVEHRKLAQEQDNKFSNFMLRKEA